MPTILPYERIDHRHLFAVNDYQRKFIGLGVVPSGYQAQDSYKVKAQQIHIDLDSTAPTQAIDVTTNTLAKMAILTEDRMTEVTPYAIELDENALTPSLFQEEFEASILNLLKMQSDRLHFAKLLSLASRRPAIAFDPKDFSQVITSLVNQASTHFSQQSRKILLIPEFIAGKLLATRLETDRSRSFLDELKDVAKHFHISLEQYPTAPSDHADILLIQHDALSVFPGSEPYLRRTYQSPNGLVQTRQFLFAVAGYLLNGREDQHDHIVVHLPLTLEE